MLAVLVAGDAVVAVAQAPADAYFEFLMARRLEGHGDSSGALAALERAAAADPSRPRSGPRSRRFICAATSAREAEKAAQAALAIDEDNVEAHRVARTDLTPTP